MPFSDNEANAILNWALGKGTLSTKSKVYLALLKNDPEADKGVCEEITGDTYKRVLISQYGESYPAKIGSASNRVIKSIDQINWVKATADWPEAKGIALFTTETGGSPYYYSKIPQPFTTESGAVALFEAGNFQVSLLDTDVDIATT